MKKQNLTPAQSYAQRIIEALSGLIDNPDNADWQADVMVLALERPLTLRNAMRVYLYKSVNQNS